MNFKYLATKYWYDLNAFATKSFKLKINKNKKRIYLFGTVEHMNYGDLAITVAEYEFLSNNLPNYEIVDIPERKVLRAIDVVKDKISPKDIICFHGGGNMGDIWESQEELRRKVFGMFKDNKIISFPQSTSYIDMSSNGNLKKTIEIIKNNSDLTVYAREQVSFDFLKNEFPTNVKIGLTPDIVLSMKTEQGLDRKDVISTFLRRDKEKLMNNEVINLINKLSNNYNINESDTVDDYWHIINRATIKPLLEKKLDEFRESKLIITDRLHGMIFAAITGTPAIVFDNNNHKIKYSYETWLKKLPYIYFADDINESDLYLIIDNCMLGSTINSYDITLLDSKFDNLIESLNY